jgi:hypothetical protein
MTSRKPRADIRMVAGLRRSNDTLSSGATLYSVEITAVFLGPDRWGPDPDRITVHNPVWSDYEWADNPLVALDGLTVHAQAERDGESGWYGQSVTYRNVYDVSEPRALAMARTLRKITRAVDAHRDQYGYELTFGAYVVVVGRTIGAFRPQPIGIRDSDYPDGYRWTGADGLNSHLDRVRRGERDDVVPSSRY